MVDARLIGRSSHVVETPDGSPASAKTPPSMCEVPHVDMRPGLVQPTRAAPTPKRPVVMPTPVPKPPAVAPVIKAPASDLRDDSDGVSDERCCTGPR